MVIEDAVVIGAGIIGTTVTVALRKRGLKVLLLDDGRPYAGTPPSGGHLKPSWFGGLKKVEYEPAMELLDQCWGMKKEEFQVVFGIKLTTTTVYRVDTDQVVLTPKTEATVTGIDFLHNCPRVQWLGGEVRCRLLVVATGAWASELINGVAVQPKQGVSFRLEAVLPAPIIRPWAPYKQVVAHQQSEKEVWVGDGSAVVPENWDRKRTDQCLARCRNVVGTGAKVCDTLIGWRPYAEPDHPGDPCLLRRLGPRAWLATGAGKSGTIAAGWVANRILQELD